MIYDANHYFDLIRIYYEFTRITLPNKNVRINE